MQRKFHGANGFVQESSTVYAIIKPEPVQEPQPATPPPRGLLQSPTSSVDGSPMHRGNYSSPPVGVVSPIRRRNSSEQNGGNSGNSGNCSNKSTPPMSPSRAALIKGVAPIASIDAHEEEEELELEQHATEDEQLAVEYVEVLEQEEEEEVAPDLPERRAPAQGALEDLHDLEYADTSAGEDEEDILHDVDVELIDDVVDEVIKVHVTTTIVAASAPAAIPIAAAAVPAPATAPVPAPAPAAGMPRDDSLPDAMTAAEAERLLSSR